MRDPYLPRRILIATVIGAAVVLATDPILTALLLAGGVTYALRAMVAGRGWGRPLPAAVLAAIVVAAHYAPVKRIEMAKARRMIVPKVLMTVDELRGPERPRLPCVYAVSSHLPAGVEECPIRFPSEELTVGEFIRSIESQTPLRHYFASCGNAGTSILFGRNLAMGLHFDVRD